MDVPKDLSNVVAIAVGSRFLERSMALKKDGTVVVWRAGEPHHEEIPAGVTNVVAIAAGKGHSLALKKDGTVFGWGDNSLCQAIGVPIATGFAAALVTVGGQTLSNVVAIAAAGDYSLALKADGTVVAWGGDKRWFAEVPAGLTGVTAISAGENHCLAITTNRSPTVLKR
jgi:alpha-tubulin suppressor-like RCC1 family protein